jgi:hypothetical protein
VRFDKIATIDKEIIAGRIGNADAAGSTGRATYFLPCSGSGPRPAEARKHDLRRKRTLTLLRN